MKVIVGNKYKVIDCDCGRIATKRLSVMNIRRDSILEIVSIQPDGPITVNVGKSTYSIGRVMFNKLILEEIK